MKKQFDKAIAKSLKHSDKAGLYRDNNQRKFEKHSNAAFYWLGVSQGLAKASDIEKEALIDGFTNQIVEIHEMIERVSEELDKEAEINPISERCKKLASRLAQHTEVLARAKAARREVKDELKGGVRW